MMRPYVIADAFASEPLRGNPVAVFTQAEGMPASLMQRIAQEFNLSETTFVFPSQSGGDYHVRIFTPVNELPFAGHPTLGTVVVLASTNSKRSITIETAMGLVPFNIERDANNHVLSVTMEQPFPTYEDYEQANRVLAALSLDSSTLPIEVYRNGPRHAFVGLPSIEALSQLNPNLYILAELEDVAINCFAGKGLNWQMRMFSPAYGVNEDAATGSAAGPLSLHLARHGKVNYGDEINIHQGVEMGRHALMRSKLVATGEATYKTLVSGSACIVAKGTFYIPNQSKLSTKAATSSADLTA